MGPFSDFTASVGQAFFFTVIETKREGMEMSEKGIKEISELVKLLAEIGNGAGKAAEDGKVSWSDALFFSKAVMSAPAAIIGIDEVYSELKDLSAQEKDQLKAQLQSDFDIPQDNVEEVVEKVLGAALHLGEVIELFKSLKK